MTFQNSVERHEFQIVLMRADAQVRNALSAAASGLPSGTKISAVELCNFIKSSRCCVKWNHRRRAAGLLISGRPQALADIRPKIAADDADFWMFS